MRGMSRRSFCRSPSAVTMIPSPCASEPGGERRRLTKIASQPDDLKSRICCVQPRQDLERPVGAAVIDEHDLECAAPPLERFGQLVTQRLEVRGFVQEGNDDRQLWTHGRHVIESE